jgi:DNA recombination protein RmuC
MTDHLLIGTLIGIVSGTIALIVIAVVTLRRFELAQQIEPRRLQRALAELQRASEQTERSLRDDLAAARRELETAARESRDESSAVARALRDEIAGGLRDVSDAFARGLGEVRGLQELGEVCALLEERLGRIQAESRDSLDQWRADTTTDAKNLRNDMLESLRAHTDAKLDGIVEQRLGESFSVVGRRLELVSERLEQVQRGLGDVQSFAAALGNIQRALTNLRPSGGHPPTEPATSPESRPVRRRPAATAPEGPGPVEAPQGAAP